MDVLNYKQAGVDIEEGYRAVDRYRELSAQTANSAVLNGIGSFAGMYSLKEIIAAGGGMEDPVLVSGTDGVGTKLDIAFKMQKYDTVGIDCVAMCVNDILCHGARPLFFLDYLACGKLDAAIAAQIVKGVATGCRETGSVLLGGETAEMPGFYDTGKYDIAGFSVGIVDRKKIIDGARIREGDAIIGIASSGPHSNGFSLIRRVIPNLDEDFGGMPIGIALLEPTRLYVKPIISLTRKIEIHGMAHITGGGFYENIPRMFFNKIDKRGGDPPLAPDLPPSASILPPPPPAGGVPPATPPHSPFDAIIYEDAWTIPPTFARIAYGCANTDDDGTHTDGAAAQKKGAELIAANAALRRQMFNTFNMGIGFVLAVNPADAHTAIAHLDNMGFPAWEIGSVRQAKDAKGAVRFVSR